MQSQSFTGQDGIEKTGVEIVLEELVILDKMPEDVSKTLELQDALSAA